MFGKKKEARVIIPEEDKEEKIAEIKRLQEETEKLIQSEKAEKIGEAQIISAELIEEGVMRYVILSNKSLGNIGDKFEV